MKVHHAQVKKAQKMGCTIEGDGDDWVAIHWPARNIRYRAASAQDAIQQMEAIQQIYEGDTFRVVPTDQPRVVVIKDVYSGFESGPLVPVEALKLLKEDQLVFSDPNAPVVEEPPAETPTEIERSPKGVALDGAIAYKEGTPSGDNPYLAEELDESEADAHQLAQEWDEAWDAAADEASEGEEKGGSVVGEKYRARYAEAGHPTHCGDWLAVLLNNLCQTKQGTDLPRFEAICAANGVDTTKYKRTGVGWEGRIRMTGRNLLAKAVFKAGGVLLTPIEGAEPQYKAPQEWMDAQRFK